MFKVAKPNKFIKKRGPVTVYTFLNAWRKVCPKHGPFAIGNKHISRCVL